MQRYNFAANPLDEAESRPFQQVMSGSTEDPLALFGHEEGEHTASACCPMSLEDITRKQLAEKINWYDRRQYQFGRPRPDAQRHDMTSHALHPLCFTEMAERLVSTFTSSVVPAAISPHSILMAPLGVDFFGSR